jgi:fatty-acyl-CoA synthase
MALHERSPGLTLASALATRATQDPDAPYLFFRDEVWTYGQVESRAEAMAAGLHSLGIGGGDRIALLLSSRPEFVISLFAIAKLGAQVVPLNPRLTGAELRYLLLHSESAAVVALESWHGVDYLQLLEDFFAGLPTLEYAVTVGEEDLWYDDRIFQFEDVLSKGEGRDYTAREADAERDLFALVYTSGTTGKPKGVELSQASLLHAAEATAGAVGLTPEDRVIGIHSLFHVFGMAPAVLGTLLAGASLILQEDFDGPETLDLVERHRATVHYGVPTTFITELHEQRRRPRDLSSLRTGIVAGGPLSGRLLREIRREVCPGLRMAYSLTETASTVCITGGSDREEGELQTVGRPVNGAEFQVLGQGGEILPVESIGEIAVRGSSLMRGYYRQPKETASVLTPEGYFRTGDLGMVDEEGLVHLVGRGKDVIIRGGFSVHPREVEDRLVAYPAVRGAVVIGVPDEVLGEVTCACITPVEGGVVSGDDLRAWCRMTLAGYKIPDLVHFMDELPVTSTGRIRRAELARILRDEVLIRRS